MHSVCQPFAVSYASRAVSVLVLPTIVRDGGAATALSKIQIFISEEWFECSLALVAVLFLSLAAAPLSAAQNAIGADDGTVTDVPFRCPALAAASSHTHPKCDLWAVGGE